MSYDSDPYARRESMKSHREDSRLSSSLQVWIFSIDRELIDELFSDNQTIQSPLQLKQLFEQERLKLS